MFDYTATSRIRRKVKTKLSRFRDRFQEEVSQSLNDIASLDGDNISLRLKRLMREKSASTSSLESINSDTNEKTYDENR